MAGFGSGNSSDVATGQSARMQLNQIPADPSGTTGPPGPSNPFGPPAGQQDLASSPAQKKAAAKAIEDHIEPDTKKSGNWADEDTTAVIKEFAAKDGHGGRLAAAGVVGVDEGPSDGSVAIDDVGGRQRERARMAVVDALEVEAEPVLDGGQVVGQIEGEAVLLPRVRTAVTEDVEGEVVLLGEGEGLVGVLRREMATGWAPRAVMTSWCCWRAVAVRAPGAAVEGQHHRAVGEQVVQGHALPGRRGQGEARGLRADGQGMVGLAGVGQLLSRPRGICCWRAS